MALQYEVIDMPKTDRRPIWVTLAVIVSVLLIALVVSWLMALPISVSADGVTLRVPAGSTVADLGELGAFHAPAGDLIGVTGAVVTVGGGEPPSILRNGAPTTLSQRIYRGDVLVSAEGLDSPEATETVDTAIAYGSEIEGTGPIVVVAEEGKKGIRRVVRGVVSGIEITSTVIAQPVDEVLRRKSAEPGSKLVALTFDDGPWPKSTDRILQVLAEEDVHATFFMLGGQVKRQPAIARRVVAGGHQVASHSLGHKKFSQISAAQIRREVKGGNAAIKRATGVTTTWIRPPYGAMDKGAWKVLRQLKVHTVMWDVDSEDWRRPGARNIARRVSRQVKPGSIVLFHDGGGERSQTIAALPLVIRKLKAQGYIFVTVEELIEADGVKKRPAAKTATPGRS